MNAKSSKVTTLEDGEQAGTAESKPATNKVKASGDVKASGSDATLSGKKVTVTFLEQDGDGGKEAVPCGLNGVVYQIPRGKPSEIPEELLEVFEHAMYQRIETVKEGGTAVRDVSRFAYQVHR